MNNTIRILCIVALTCLSVAAYCAGPEDAVKGMLDAAKAGDWEKACSFMDIEGMTKAMKEMMANMTKDMDAESKKAMEENMGDMTDPVKFKAKMIEEMKKDESKKDMTYKIIEVKDKKEDSAIVVTEITEPGKDPETVNFPVKKLNNKWVINFADMAAAPPEVVEEGEGETGTEEKEDESE